MLMFAVSKQRLLQQREIEISFVYIIDRYCSQEHRPLFYGHYSGQPALASTCR